MHFRTCRKEEGRKEEGDLLDNFAVLHRCPTNGQNASFGVAVGPGSRGRGRAGKMKINFLVKKR